MLTTQALGPVCYVRIQWIRRQSTSWRGNLMLVELKFSLYYRNDSVRTLFKLQLHRLNNFLVVSGVDLQ
jgi:hypothetical protein